jgi:hypothetical protein
MMTVSFYLDAFDQTFCISPTTINTIAPAINPIPKLINVGVNAPIIEPKLGLTPNDQQFLQ